MSGAGDPPFAEPEEAGSRRRRRHLRPWISLGVLAVLGLLVALRPHSQLGAVPAGRFGTTIRCLEREADFRVRDVRTGGVTTRRTTAVSLLPSFGDDPLVRVADAGTAAGARAAVRANRFGEVTRSDYRTSGPIVWAYTETGTPPRISANAGQRSLVAYCAGRGAH